MRILRISFVVVVAAVSILSSACVSQSTYAELQTRYDTLAQANASLTSDLDGLQARNNNLTVAHEALEENHKTLQAAYDTLDTNHKAVEVLYAQVQENLAKEAQALVDLHAIRVDLDKQLVQTQADRDQVRQSYEALKTEVGGVEALQAQQKQLQDSVTSLKADVDKAIQQRKALIPAYSFTHVICSGSMDPAMTCMDSPEWIDNPRAEEIVVGAVISFDPPSDCNLASTDLHVAHRVTTVQKLGDSYSYRTKGDNNPTEDGCWVPFAKVDGYLVSLKKGYDPDMQALLDQIWPLERKRDQLYADLQALSTHITQLHVDYETADAAYDAKYQAYCAGTPQGQTCTLSSGTYAIVKPLQDQVEQARIALNAAVASYNSTRTQLLNLQAQIRTLRNQLEALRCTKLYSCTPYPIP